MRRQVGRQLNRGEHRQAVVRHVFFADHGEFRTGDLAQIMNKVSCLSLLSNAILVWNTVHISNIVSRLREDGYTVPDETLAKVSPLLRISTSSSMACMILPAGVVNPKQVQ